MKIVGDYNVQLPMTKTLSPTWYRQRGFTPHSYAMWNFLLGNDLIVADFLHRQPTPYTYFCHKRSIYTWIEHMTSSKHDVSIIRSCEIIPLECTNVSDHLPLRLTLQLVHCPATVSQSTQPAHKIQGRSFYIRRYAAAYHLIFYIFKKKYISYLGIFISI